MSGCLKTVIFIFLIAALFSSLSNAGDNVEVAVYGSLFAIVGLVIFVCKVFMSSGSGHAGGSSSMDPLDHQIFHDTTHLDD